VGDTGVVAFVSNGGWIDGNTADGMRLALAEDYSAIYVYNLRGNQRTAGELSRKEGGKIFGGGSRNTVAVFICVRNAASTEPCQIHYRDIGDYLDRECSGTPLESSVYQRILFTFCSRASRCFRYCSVA
jgi:predicted helicase